MGRVQSHLQQLFYQWNQCDPWLLSSFLRLSEATPAGFFLNSAGVTDNALMPRRQGDARLDSSEHRSCDL